MSKYFKQSAILISSVMNHNILIHHLFEKGKENNVLAIAELFALFDDLNIFLNNDTFILV